MKPVVKPCAIRVVVVACSPSVQLERLVARTQLDRSAAEQMIQSQMPLTEKIAGPITSFGTTADARCSRRRRDCSRSIGRRGLDGRREFNADRARIGDGRRRAAVTRIPACNEGIAAETTRQYPDVARSERTPGARAGGDRKALPRFRSAHSSRADPASSDSRPGSRRARPGISVTATGFFDQVADSFGVLRWPRLNFLPVPEDVGVPRAIIAAIPFQAGPKDQRHGAAAARPRKTAHARRGDCDRRRAARAMEGADSVRQPDAAFSGRPDHAREFEDEFDQRARGRSAHAARARPTRA